MLSLLDFVASFNEYTSLRTLKIIRPLRTISRFKVQKRERALQFSLPQ
jgi:hypothetical protein